MSKLPETFLSLVDLLRERAELRPDDTIYIYLRDGNKDERKLTYGELDRRARKLGAALQQRTSPGDRILINHLPGIDYIVSFFGVLYAGLTAVPVYPPRFNQKLDRLRSIVSDVSPRVSLSSQTHIDSFESVRQENNWLEATCWLCTDTLIGEEGNPWHVPELTGQETAFIQYTSGSTSQPKGVMLSHQNILTNTKIIADCGELDENSHGAIWLPPYHDMGLIGGLLVPLYRGFPVVLMSPYAFLQRPHRWLQMISRYKADVSSAPNFAFDLCARRVSEKQAEGLDLSSWKVAFCGAEPIHSDILDRFAKKFGPYGFKKETIYPCYGLAESTLILTGGKREQSPVVYHFQREALETESRGKLAKPTDPGAKPLVSCGDGFSGHEVAVMDPQALVACEEGKIGEIWFRGPSVAKGYWGKEELTQKVFNATRADTDQSGYLRTGDLGFLYDGHLFVTGRIKDLLIIRGKNYYPQDIEKTVTQSHPLLKVGACAAFAVEGSGKEQLVVVQEVERKASEGHYDELIEVITEQVVAEHGISPYAVSLIRSNSIPLTSSGKIQRYASRQRFLKNELQELKRVVLSA